MESKAPQFSAYDILGYLVPGLFLMLFIDISMVYHFQVDKFDYTSILKRYSQIPIGAAIPLLLISYFAGHIISFVSAMTIERHAKWLYGNPMKILLIKWAWKRIGYLQTGGKNKIFSKMLRIAVSIFLMPIFLYEYPLYKFDILKNYIKPMSNDLRRTALLAVFSLAKRYKVMINKYTYFSSEFEQLSINFTSEKAPSHLFTLRNYIVLYGFMRSMTLVLIIASWSCIVHFGLLNIKISNCMIVPLLQLITITLLTGFFCSISYGCFLKFWLRYHREALLGMTTVLLEQEYEKSTASDGQQKNKE